MANQAKRTVTLCKDTEDEILQAKLEKIAEMLEVARRIVEALECGETVEKEKEAGLAIEEAQDAARELLKIKVEDD